MLRLVSAETLNSIAVLIQLTNKLQDEKAYCSKYDRVSLLCM